MKTMKTTTVERSEYMDECYKDPSTYFIVNALGQRVYFHSRDREACQKACDEMYGVGFYKVRTNKQGKSGGELSCRGSVNNKSRSGSYVKQVHSNQGRF